MTTLPELWQFKDLVIQPNQQEDRLVCIWQGAVHFTDAQDPASAVLEQVHAFMLEAKLPTLVHDLIDVPLVNSSGLKAFLKAIGLLKRLPEEDQYQMIFRYDPEVSWQQKHLPELKLMMPKAVSAIAKDDDEE